jgi:hypothetical protein
VTVLTRDRRPSFWDSPRATALAAAVLAALAWLVFNPALNRVFAADHLWYFAEVHGQSTLSAGLRLVDYAASRVYWRGDDVTFRPLLFTWMAIANALFSYHHPWWNAANLAIHVLVGVALFRLLAAIRPSIFALLAAALFLVLTPPIELVLWNHLGGYLWAWFCLAIGLHAFAVLTGVTPSVEPSASTLERATMQFVIAFGAGALFYEALAVVGFVLALIVLWCEWRRATLHTARAAALLSPTVLFVALYAWHATRVPRMGYIHGTAVQEPVSRLLNVLPLAWNAGRHWLWEIAMPTTLTLSSHAFERFTIAVSSWPATPLQWANALIVIAAIVLTLLSTSKRRLLQTLPFLIGVLLAAAKYVALLAFGRASQDLYEASYYPYVFGLLTIVFVYTLIDQERLTAAKRVAGLAATFGFFAFHVSATMKVIQGVEAANRFQSRYFAKLITFVDEHKREPGFTFAIQPHPESLDPQVGLVRGYPDDPHPLTESRRASEILFEPYYRDHNPKYLLDASAGHVVSGSRLP